MTYELIQPDGTVAKLHEPRMLPYLTHTMEFRPLEPEQTVEVVGKRTKRNHRTEEPANV